MEVEDEEGSAREEMRRDLRKSNSPICIRLEILYDGLIIVFDTNTTT